MRGISFERFFHSQRDIEGRAEGKIKKEKASKENKSELPKTQVLRTPEEVQAETAGLAELKKKPKVDLGGKIINKEHLDLEEGLEEEAAKEEEKRKKEDPMYCKPESAVKKHRKGRKPYKVERDTIREYSDIDEAA